MPWPTAFGPSSPSPRGNEGSDQLKLGLDVDGAPDAAGDRAEAGVEVVHAFDLLAAVLRDGEPIADRDAPDHQDLLVKHNLADRLDLKALRIDLDVTRFQRAGEGAGQSAAGGGYDVVKRGRVRRILLGRDAVVLGDLRVHPKHHRLLLCREVREPLRPAEPLDPYPRNIRRCFSHQPSLAGRLGLFALAVRGACVPEHEDMG